VKEQQMRDFVIMQRSRRLLYLSLQIFIALIVLVNCRAQDTSQNNIVARIAGKYTISFPELKQYVIDYQYYYRYNRNIPVAMDSALQDMIVNRMKIIDFFNMGLDKKEGLLEGMMRILNEELVIHYFNTQFYGKYVNDDAVQKAYEQLGQEVIYRQIVLAKPKNASGKTISSLRSLARTIKKKIQNGADFGDLVKKYSQDVKTRNQGGLMPPLNWKMSLLSAVYDTVSHLAVNEASVVESKEAIHIVKVDRIDTVNVPPYAKVREEVRQALAEKYMSVASNDFDQTKKILVDERPLQWNKKAIRQLLRWSNIPRFYVAAYSDTLNYAISHGNNFLILKYSTGKVDLKEYLRLLNDVLTLGNIPGIKEDNLKKFILEAVRTDKVVNKARELNLEKDIFNPQTKNPDLQDGIIRLYNSQVVEKQIPPATKEALKAFYQANRDSLFYQLAKVNIYALIDSSKSTIEKMKHELHQNIPLEKLARAVQVKTFIRTRDGKIVSYLSIEPPYLGEAAFRLKLFETAGPIEYIDSVKGKQYALIKCMAIREEKQLTYKDVQETIAKQFAEFHRERLFAATDEYLRKKYPVTIYNDVINRNLSATGIRVEE
jgi:hypothetical protein